MRSNYQFTGDDIRGCCWSGIYFLDIRYTQYQIAGSLISKLVLLTILRVLKALKHSSLKRKIPFSYWCMLFSIPMGSIFILNTLFMLCERSDDKNAAVFV